MTKAQMQEVAESLASVCLRHLGGMSKHVGLPPVGGSAF